MKEIFDITIVGGGPVGLYTAFYAGMRQAKVKIIESLDRLGGQPEHIYPQQILNDLAGYPDILAKDFVAKLVDQGQRYQPTICLGEEVTDLKKIRDSQGHDVFQLSSHIGTHFSRTVIIAAGNGAFQPRRVQLPKHLNENISNLYYFVPDLESFSGGSLAILGGGDAAVDWATSLAPHCKQIHLIHRRHQFRAHESAVAGLKTWDNIHIHRDCLLHDLQVDQGKIRQITLKNKSKQENYTLKVDGIIVAYGFVSNIGQIRHWDLELERNKIRITSQCQSSQTGVFAVGDVAYYPGRTNLMTVGFGEAPIAVDSALLYINPQAAINPIYTSDIPGG